jgi:2-aminoadipate transaminase
VAVTPTPRAWEELFAARTRGGVGEGIAEILALLEVPGLISFAGGFPDPRTFPRGRASQLLSEFAETGEASAFQYAPTRGLTGPLDALAGRIETMQGRRPGDDELMITSGSIEALELTGKAFLDAGDTVVVEGPTYLGALMAFRGFAAEIAVVPLYTIPDHQNPAGVSMSTERREALVALARHHGFVIFEDVAYRDLNLDGEDLPSLWSLAPDAVVQAGTTSKTFFPGVRLGWAASPAVISSQLVSAKQNTDQCAGALGQRFFEEYVRRGYLDEQLAASRALYREKRDRMLAALERSMPSTVHWTTPRGGFFSWLTLPSDGGAELAADAAAGGVGVVPGSLFYPDGRGSGNVRLSFSLVHESQIDAGIETLARLV